jgi:hypothetical protein
MKKMALGRGLSALIPTAPEERPGKNFVMLNLDEIVPNVNQPRKFFEEEKLAQLAESNSGESCSRSSCERPTASMKWLPVSDVFAPRRE